MALFGLDLPFKYTTFRNHDDGISNFNLLGKSISTDGIELKINVVEFGKARIKKSINYKKKVQDYAPQLQKLASTQILPNLVVRMDLGVGNVAAGCVIDTRGGNHQFIRRNIVISKAALNQPNYLFNDYLEDKKNEAPRIRDSSITDLEVAPSIRDLENTSLDKDSEESGNRYYNRIINRYEQLSNFYNSRLLKKRRWDLRKAQIGEYDRAVHGILQSVNGKIGKKY